MVGTARRPLVAGNWKMNGLAASATEFGKIVAGAAGLAGQADVMICPPATLLSTLAAAAKGSPVAIGGQDCHAEPTGAFTGDIAAEMLADAGATAVIVGHSERRTIHKETDAQVRAKALAAWRAGLTAIVCIGETKAEREAGQTLDVLGRQLDGSLPDGATGSTWWSPMSRSGRSAAGSRRPWPMSRRRTASSGDALRSAMGRPRRPSASSTAAR